MQRQKVLGVPTNSKEDSSVETVSKVENFKRRDQGVHWESLYKSW